MQMGRNKIREREQGRERERERAEEGVNRETASARDEFFYFTRILLLTQGWSRLLTSGLQVECVRLTDPRTLWIY